MINYKNLLNYLISNKNLSLNELKKLKVCYEPLEDIFVLFCHLKIIGKFNNFNISNKSFNNGFIGNENKLINFLDTNCKNNGSYSDMTLYNNEKVIATTCKNIKTININKLDIEKIENNYSDKRELILCIVISDKEKLYDKIYNSRKTSINIKNSLLKKSTLIFDWNDIYFWYSTIFKQINFDNLKLNNKPFLKLKFHQENCVKKYFKSKKKNFIIAFKCRSGKTYILAGIIDKLTGNILIITSAPTETFEQLYSVFNEHSNFEKYNIIVCKSGNTNLNLAENNIIICSIQFLKNSKDNKIKNQLKKLNYNIRIIDEAHFHTMTNESEKVYNNYGKNCKTIWMSGTPRKIINNLTNYDIVYFGLEDEMKLKNDNHMDYLNCPDLKTFNLTFETEFKLNLQNACNKYNYGFDIPNLFNLDENKRFKEPRLMYEFLKMIFGSNKEYDSNDNYMLKNIEDYQLQNNSRISTKKEPKIFLFFLPCHLINSSINDISNQLQEFMKEEDFIYEYHTLSINSQINGNKLPQNIINDELEITKKLGKKGLIVFAGKQLSLGITLRECDVVFMCNGISNLDLIYQQTFRCMTEDKDKKFGILVDCHLQRKITISLIFDQVFKLNNKKNILNNIDYVITHIIRINKKDWINYFKLTNETEISKNIFQMYINGINNIDGLFDSFNITLTDKDQQEINKIVGKNFINKEIKKVFESNNTDILEANNEIVRNNNENKEKEIKEKIENDNNIKIFKNIIKYLIPVFHLLCINLNSCNFYDLWENIINNKFKKELFSGIIKTFWNNNLNIEKIKTIINITMDYFENNQEFLIINERINSLMKEFKTNKFKMSELIDKYLTPTEFERKNNAEVSTPEKLAREMINLIPKEFWTTIKKVFDPCCGKGIFCILIFEYFFEGLKESEPDEELRTILILEKCLYFNDLNPLNRYITCLLLDPENKYNLNCDKGIEEIDTLKMEFEFKFDLVIGNPPYSTDPSKQNTKTIYNLFIEKFINFCDLMVYVIPSRWFIGGKGLDKFRNMMTKRKDIKFIIHEDDAKKWFNKHLDIKGGVCYFLIDKKYNGKCKFNNIDYDLGLYDCIIKPEFHSIINKIKNYENITNRYISSGFFKYRTNDKRLKNNGNIKCFVSKLKSKNRIKYIDNYEFNDKNTFWKVITPRAAHGSYSGFGEFFIGTPNDIYTDSYISFKVKSELEAHNLIGYLKTDFINYLLSIRKISQDINENVCKWIPSVPLDRKWNNENIYNFFNINNNEK